MYFAFIAMEKQKVKITIKPTNPNLALIFSSMDIIIKIKNYINRNRLLFILFAIIISTVCSMLVHFANVEKTHIGTMLCGTRFRFLFFLPHYQSMGHGTLFTL